MAGETETVSLNLEGDFAANAEKDAAAAGKLASELDKLREASKKAKGLGDGVGKGFGGVTPTALLGSGGAASGFQKLVQAAGQAFGPKAAEGLVKAGGLLEQAGPALAAAGPLLASAASATVAAGAAIAAGAAALTVAAGALVYAGVKLGISEATKNEIQGTVLDAITGGKGDSAIKVATKVALDIGIDDDTALDRMKRLLNAKFSEGQAAQIIKVGVGIDAVLGAGSGDAFAKVLQDVKNLGDFSEKSMKKFAKEGISADDVYARLAQTLGTSVDQVKAKIKSGTLDVNKGVEAVLAVADKKFGGIAEKLGNSIPGMFVKIQTAFKGLFGNIDLGPIKGFLKNVLGVITGPAGEGFSKAFGKLSDTILKLLFGPLGDKSAADKMASVVNVITKGVTFLNSALTGGGNIAGRAWGVIKSAFATGSVIVSAAWNAIKPAVAAIKLGLAEVMSTKAGSTGAEIRGVVKSLFELWTTIKPGVILLAKLVGGAGLLFVGQIAKAAATGIKMMLPVLNALATGLRIAVGAITSFVQIFTGASAKSRSAASAMGRGIPSALASGILGSMGAAIAAAGTMASGVLGAIKGVLQFKSPPKALINIGKAFGPAMGSGINDNAGDAKKAGAKLAAGAAAGAASGGAGGGGGGGSPTFNIIINAAPGMSAGDARELGGAAVEGAYAAWKKNARRFEREQQEGRAA